MTTAPFEVDRARLPSGSAPPPTAAIVEPVDEQPAALVLGAGVVHRDDDGVRGRASSRALPGCDSRSPASVWRMKLAFSQYSEIVAAST